MRKGHLLIIYENSFVHFGKKFILQQTFKLLAGKEREHFGHGRYPGLVQPCFLLHKLWLDKLFPNLDNDSFSQLNYALYWNTSASVFWKACSTRVHEASRYKSQCFSIFLFCATMKSSNKDEASSSEHDEEDAAVFIYDRRAGSRPEEKIQLGGIFNFTTFKEKTRQVSGRFPATLMLISVKLEITFC